MDETPETTRAKTQTNNEIISKTVITVTATEISTCKHFVKRKKRYCRLIPAKGEQFCGEHTPLTNILPEPTKQYNARVPCPLDPKHTICARKLQKHLKICNALVKDQPNYIVTGLNAGQDDTDASDRLNEFKLTDIDKKTVDKVVDKVNKLYALYQIDDKIDDLIASHSLLASEINNEEYGHEATRHLIQTSTILGYLEYFKLFDDYISYVEYGAGKGQVSYWLAQAIANYPNSNVLLIDRASVRHKRDNKLNETHAVQRIRADIADFDIGAHSLIQNAKKIVGLGKHLCGAATDFAIQCSIHGNKMAESRHGPKTAAILIALCCHHRCEWKHFVGKNFFIENDVTIKEFAIITKMVGWAICGTGMSRERRKQLESMKNQTEDDNKDATKRDRHERKEIGQKCKRLIDFARICYLEQNGFKCSLNRFVSSNITLENICLVATHESQ